MILAAAFISVVVYPPTLRFTTMSFLLKNATVTLPNLLVSNSMLEISTLKIFFCTVRWAEKLGHSGKGVKASRKTSKPLLRDTTSTPGLLSIQLIQQR